MAEGCFTIISYPLPKNNLQSLPPTCRKGSNFANVNQRANHLIVITPSLWFLGLITVQPPCLAAVFFSSSFATLLLHRHSFQFLVVPPSLFQTKGIAKANSRTNKRDRTAHKEIEPKSKQGSPPATSCQDEDGLHLAQFHSFTPIPAVA